jgi:hypothetical protein
MNNMRNKILMTLALLLTAVTGAWAQSYEAKVFDVPASWTGDETYLSAADLPKDFVQITKDEAEALAVPDGNVILIYDFEGENVKVLLFMSGTLIDEDEAPWGRGMFEQYQTNSNAIICYTAPAEPKVAWDPATKTGNFTMPAYDVELTPIYAPVAQWAKVENVDQLPTAIEGIYAESTDAIVKAGTVAKIGETENPQGTVMYAVGTSATEQPALTAFSATLPTAENITAAGDVYVWYYIKGADTPTGEKATAENTFNDSEICPEPITVTLLSNKFDIQFTAANANTIEAGKATVTVGGTAATVTEGKLEGVKMGTEVKVTAKEGYKFRKVEVKKKGAKADPSETITFSGGKNANYTYTGTHFSATGEADPTDGTFELNKWSSVTINATDGKTITKVVFSYRENGNNDLDQLSFSSGTFDGIDTVNDVNATMLSVTSTTVGATKLNGVTIYYK